MDFLSETVVDGVRERQFIVGEVTGALWSDPDAFGTTPLLLIGHTEGQNRLKPDVFALARSYVDLGCTVAVIDAPCHGGRLRNERHLELIDDMQRRFEEEPITAADAFHHEIAPQAIEEWHATLDALQGLDEVDAEGPVGFHGLALGSMTGVPFVAQDDRVTAAVLGLVRRETIDERAFEVRLPVQFRMQWDDELVPRDSALALFDDLGSSDKTLHANPGGHRDAPAHELESARRFLARHLGLASTADETPARDVLATRH